MTWRRWSTVWAFALGLSMSSTAFAQTPPFAGDPDKKSETPRPAIRNWTVNTGGFSYSMEFNPGIPKPGQVVEVIISVARIPKTPHPQFGNRIPERGARFVVALKKPSGELIGRFRAHPLPLTRGRYGLHFTPTTKGLFDLSIEGKSGEGLEMRAATKVPVDVWPLPTELHGEGDKAGTIRRRRPIIVPQ